MIYTYLLAANNLFKIGKTKNIKKRLSILGTASPDIQLIDFCNEDIEKQLHIIFKDKRYKKEWFKLEKEDLKGIEEIFFEINNKLI